MEIRNKNILIISPEPWHHVFVSKHHYAIHLARLGNTVYFLNPPTDNYTIEQTTFSGVFSIHYSGFRRGLRFYPTFLQRWIFKYMFKMLERFCDVKFDLIWSFDNSVFFDLSAFSDRVLKICHIVDANQDFQTGRLASTSDFCFCTTEFIRNRLLKYNRRVYKIHHGYNEVSAVTDVALPGSAKVKIVYAGNLSIPYIDWNLLLNLIESHPHQDFVFIGPNAYDFSARNASSMRCKEKVVKLANVFCIGKVDAQTLPSYLTKADVLLVTYLQQYQQDQVANPHKMMEYLGAGRIIVSTFTAEFTLDSDLIMMSSSNDQYLQIFRSVLHRLDYYNNKALMEKRRSYALNNSYDNQIRRIEKIIQNDISE